MRANVGADCRNVPDCGIRSHPTLLGQAGLAERNGCRSEKGVMAGMVGGFCVFPEGDAVGVATENISPFSLPQDVLTFVPNAEAVTAHFRNGESERKIHCNTELLPEEQERLQSLQELSRQRGKPLLPSVAIAATRYLSRNRGNVRRAFREMLATQEWRLAYFQGGPITDASIMADLAHGITYFTGRDSSLRPALVIRPGRIPQAWLRDKRAAADRVVRLLVFCMEYFLRYMAAPGRAEGGVVLLDLGGLTLAQVSLSSLTAVCTVMSNHYVNRIFRFYVLNVPPSISRVATVGLRLLTERQRQKLHFVRAFDELRKEFALHQLEEDLGGTRPVLTVFFPFPLQPGPFEAGYAGGPDQNAVPRVHEAITKAGLRGRLWDPALSAAENAELEYSEAAEGIFRRCGLPPPPSCTLEPPGRSRASSAIPLECKRSPECGSWPPRCSNTGAESPEAGIGCKTVSAEASARNEEKGGAKVKEEFFARVIDGCGEGEEPSTLQGTDSLAAVSTDRLGEEDDSWDAHEHVFIQHAEVKLRSCCFCQPTCSRG